MFSLMKELNLTNVKSSNLDKFQQNKTNIWTILTSYVNENKSLEVKRPCLKHKTNVRRTGQ